MMKSIKQQVETLSRNDLYQEIKEQELSWWLDDIFKLIKNINETSIGPSDRTARILELEQKYGIPKTHLL